jgi:hypothetical protein
MRRSIIIAAAVLAAGCAAVPRADSVRAGDSPADVQKRLGPPAAERKLASGESAWYYVTGPSGFQTWRVVFAPGGGVKEYRQVLDMASFEWMRTGATRDEVLDRVGPPMQRMRFAGTHTEAWSYRWVDGSLEMIGEPVFDEKTGKAVSVGIFRDPAYSSTPGSQR